MPPNVSNSLTEPELRRRLPEVFKIGDTRIREQTIAAFLQFCPDYFWKRPASSTGKYHLADHTGTHGLWLHTRRAATLFNHLADIDIALGYFGSTEKAMGQAAILLHDMFKYGWDPVEDHTTDDHGVFAGNVLEANTDLPLAVIECIRTHDGKWSDHWRTPGNALEHAHHRADYLASRKTVTAAVTKHPDKHLPTEFQHQFSGLWTSDHTQPPTITVPTDHGFDHAVGHAPHPSDD